MVHLIPGYKDVPRSWRETISGMLEGAGQALWETELPIGGGALEIPGLSLANVSRMPFKDYRTFSTELLTQEAPSFIVSELQKLLPGYEGRTLGQDQEA